MSPGVARRAVLGRFLGRLEVLLVLELVRDVVHGHKVRDVGRNQRRHREGDERPDRSRDRTPGEAAPKATAPLRISAGTRPWTASVMTIGTTDPR